MTTRKILNELREEIYLYCDNNKKALGIIDRYIEVIERFKKGEENE